MTLLWCSGCAFFRPRWFSATTLLREQRLCLLTSRGFSALTLLWEQRLRLSFLTVVFGFNFEMGAAFFGFDFAVGAPTWPFTLKARVFARGKRFYVTVDGVGFNENLRLKRNSVMPFWGKISATAVRSRNLAMPSGEIRQ